MNEGKLSLFANYFKGDLNTNKTLLIKNGFVIKTNDKYELTKSGKKLLTIVEIKLDKKLEM